MVLPRFAFERMRLRWLLALSDRDFPTRGPEGLFLARAAFTPPAEFFLFEVCLIM